MALVTLLDIRRGVLFAEYPARTFFLVFNPWHVPMLVIAMAGMFACYRGLIRRDARRAGTSRHLKTVTIVILTLLVVDLFAYRGVPAARSIASGRLTGLAGRLRRHRVVDARRTGHQLPAERLARDDAGDSVIGPGADGAAGILRVVGQASRVHRVALDRSDDRGYSGGRTVSVTARRDRLSELLCESESAAGLLIVFTKKKEPRRHHAGDGASLSMCGP